MVLLTTTPTILAAISHLPPSTRNSLPSPLPSKPSEPIAHSTLILLARRLRQQVGHGTNKTYALNTLLRGTTVYQPPPPAPPTKSPEYLALMASLRAEQEAREYRQLTTQSNASLLSALAEEQDDPITPSLVLNILLSIIMCGLATFWMTRWWANEGVRVLVSMLVAIVVGVAEVVVYAGFVRKMKRGREKEAKVKERKVVVGEYKGVGDEVALTAEDGEVAREEIWGRGKHGGARRRVREKWEKEQEKAKAGGEDEKKDQ